MYYDRALLHEEVPDFWFQLVEAGSTSHLKPDQALPLDYSREQKRCSTELISHPFREKFRHTLPDYR